MGLCSHWLMSHHGAILCLLVSSISEDDMGAWRGWGGGNPNFLIFKNLVLDCQIWRNSSCVAKHTNKQLYEIERK